MAANTTVVWMFVKMYNYSSGSITCQIWKCVPSITIDKTNLYFSTLICILILLKLKEGATEVVSSNFDQGEVYNIMW